MSLKKTEILERSSLRDLNVPHCLRSANSNKEHQLRGKEEKWKSTYGLKGRSFSSQSVRLKDLVHKSTSLGAYGEEWGKEGRKHRRTR